MKKILILGAQGNLGQQLAAVFNADNEVICYDRAELDITNKEAIEDSIKKIKPDIIINTAAYNAMDKCEDNEEEFNKAKKINGEAVGLIAQAALDNDALFIHYSSDYVFDGEKKDGYNENDKPNPVSQYGRSKFLGEQELLKVAANGLKYYLIRTSKLFGTKGISDAAKESFFDLMSRLAKDKKEFNMVDKEEISCFTYTLDLARATLKLIDDENPYGIYHITNTEAASWYDAAKYLFELKNITDVKLNPISSAEYPRLAARPPFSILLNTKLPPLRSWREALREYLN